MTATIWDDYGRWDDIAKLADVSAVRDQITGGTETWQPNFLSRQIEYVFRFAVAEGEASGSLSRPTIVDFGLGLGRNGPMLADNFPRVVGYDLPEMVELFQAQNAGLEATPYDAIYTSIDQMNAAEKPAILYDSVVLQHILDEAYLTDIIDRLNANPGLRTIVSMFNSTLQCPHIHLLQTRGWWIWHSEADTLSFAGFPHTTLALRRVAT